MAYYHGSSCTSLACLTTAEHGNLKQLGVAFNGTSCLRGIEVVHGSIGRSLCLNRWKERAAAWTVLDIQFSPQL